MNNSNDLDSKLLDKLLKLIFEQFENFVEEPTLKNLETFINYSHEYIDSRLSTDLDKQEVKKNISSLLLQLYLNSTHASIPQFVGNSLRKSKTKFDRNMEFYQRRVSSRNKSRTRRPIKEFSDKQKLNIFLNYLSEVISTTEYSFDKSLRIKLTLKKLNFDKDTFNGLNIKSAMSYTRQKGILKSTFYLNMFAKIEEPFEKWQNQRWYTRRESSNNNSEIVCQGVLPSYPFASIFEKILGLVPGGTESIFAKEDLFTDTHTQVRNGFVLNGYHKENKHKWEEFLLPNTEKALLMQNNLNALVIESRGQRGQQFLSEEKHLWRDVFIFSDELITFRSLTDDLEFTPSVSIPLLPGGWRMSNNMPEIPVQCMKEFIYHYMYNYISQNQKDIKNPSLEIGPIDTYLEFFSNKEIAKKLQISEEDVRRLQDGKLPKKTSIFDD